MSEEQKKEKLSELRRKEQAIQDILAKKTKELKKICLREAVRNHSELKFLYTGTKHFARHIKVLLLWVFLLLFFFYTVRFNLLNSLY